MQELQETYGSHSFVNKRGPIPVQDYPLFREGAGAGKAMFKIGILEAS